MSKSQFCKDIDHFYCLGCIVGYWRTRVGVWVIVVYEGETFLRMTEKIENGKFICWSTTERMRCN